MARRDKKQVTFFRIGIATVLMSGALALTGCTAGPDSPPGETPTSAASVTDEATCTAFGDVLTIAANADAGLRDGRMATQEQKGWYRLAARMLDRVPTSGDGAVSDAVIALKDAAPATPQGVMGTTWVGSDAWNSHMEAMSTACSDAGSELGIEMFTGG